MTRIAWFHCFSGVAGDMALGALLDAGADIDEVRAAIGSLGVGGWSLHLQRTQRCGIGAAKAVVHAPDDHHHRPFGEIRDLLLRADLPERVRTRSLAVFTALAEVEGAIHGEPPDEVEFHEVGARDAIVDVVGTCAALESLGIDEVHCSPIAVGLGTFQAAHGTLPNPGPAVVGLLARTGSPAHGVALDVELTTPTGAALMTALAAGFGPLPAMAVGAVGYGAGTRELAGRPNVTQVVIGNADAAATRGQQVVELQANLDDATGEVLAHTVTALLAAGAHDAWVTPIVMKKGRPAHTVHALCDPSAAGVVGEVMTRESGTLGLRAVTAERWPQHRHETTVDIDGEAVRVKVGHHRVKVEYDDAARAAQRLGLPLRDVLHRAEHAAAASPIEQDGHP